MTDGTTVGNCAAAVTTDGLTQIIPVVLGQELGAFQANPNRINGFFCPGDGSDARAASALRPPLPIDVSTAGASIATGQTVSLNAEIENVDPTYTRTGMLWAIIAIDYVILGEPGAIPFLDINVAGTRYRPSFLYATSERTEAGRHFALPAPTSLLAPGSSESISVSMRVVNPGGMEISVDSYGLSLKGVLL